MIEEKKREANEKPGWLTKKINQEEVVPILGTEMKRSTIDVASTVTGWSLAGLGATAAFTNFEVSSPQFWIYLIGSILAGVMGQLSGK